MLDVAPGIAVQFEPVFEQRSHWYAYDEATGLHVPSLVLEATCPTTADPVNVGAVTFAGGTTGSGENASTTSGAAYDPAGAAASECRPKRIFATADVTPDALAVATAAAAEDDVEIGYHGSVSNAVHDPLLSTFQLPSVDAPTARRQAPKNEPAEKLDQVVPTPTL